MVSNPISFRFFLFSYLNVFLYPISQPFFHSPVSCILQGVCTINLLSHFFSAPSPSSLSTSLVELTDLFSLTVLYASHSAHFPSTPPPKALSLYLLYSFPSHRSLILPSLAFHQNIYISFLYHPTFISSLQSLAAIAYRGFTVPTFHISWKTISKNNAAAWLFLNGICVEVFAWLIGSLGPCIME